jgi:hypothetical protein
LNERNTFPANDLPLLLRKDFHSRKLAKLCRLSAPTIASCAL